MLITREDIQRIGDEETLLHFLEEKLNLPIPKDLTLEDITTRFSNFSLGLSGVVANQVLDCQELSVSPGEPSGIILIRFNSESGYAEVLRAVAEGLNRQGRNPADLYFICMKKDFQPFAIANFNDSESKDWQTAILNIRAWTQDNTHIHTSSEHGFSDTFFTNEYSEDFDNEDFFDESDTFDFDEFLSKTDVDNLDNKPVNYTTKPISSKVLLTKVEKIGTPLRVYWNVHRGVGIGYSKAYIINESKRQELINADPNSKDLIKPYILKPKKKWNTESKNIIWLPHDEENKWPWSKAENEKAAEQIFENTYPAIKAHLHKYKNELQKRHSVTQGEFYWEIASRKHYALLHHRKIVYPQDSRSMRACYDTLGSLHLSNSLFIRSRQSRCPDWFWLTNRLKLNNSLLVAVDDLFLIAILNSTFFEWYAQSKYKDSEKKANLNLSQKNMMNFPIIEEENNRKIDIAQLVKQILNDPDSPKVADIEREIDQLVYKLYELTPAEIALIEEEPTNESFSYRWDGQY